MIVFKCCKVSGQLGLTGNIIGAPESIDIVLTITEIAKQGVASFLKSIKFHGSLYFAYLQSHCLPTPSEQAEGCCFKKDMLELEKQDGIFILRRKKPWGLGLCS